MATIGRPPIYSEALAAEVLARLAQGESLRAVCRDPEMPDMSTVWKWSVEIPEFTHRYAQAREARAELMFEELDDVGEEAANPENAIAVPGLRLKSDNIKWKLARMSPKKYGDKIEQTHTGAIDHNLSVSFEGRK